MDENMKSTFSMSVAIFVIFLSNACNEKLSFESQSDPASDKYVPPQPVALKGLIVTDFDDDPMLSVWGVVHGEFGQRDGKIIKTFVIDEIPGKDTTRVMQLDFDVSANSSSQAIWYQVLGDNSNNLGPFNAKVMGFKSLTFWLRGNEGNEGFNVTLLDLDGRVSSSPPGIVAEKSWKKIRIPIESLLPGPVDLIRLNTINFSFYNGIGPTNRGRIFVDELMFEWE